MNDHEEMSHAERRVRTGQTVRIVVWLALIAVVVVFAVVNTGKVTVDWVFSDKEAPLWVVIGISAVVGAAVGLIARPRKR